MQPLDFLAAVLPSSGVYCVAEFNTKKKEHIFVNDIVDMEPAINKLLGEGRDVYFALANFKEADSREASNAKSMKALFMDIDLICKGKVMYETKKDAEIAFKTFMANTDMASLGAPYIVSSGGGFQIGRAHV